MVPTYLAYLTIFISLNSSQFVATQSNSDWQVSLPYCTQQHFRRFKLSPAVWSTNLKARLRAVINRRKDEATKRPLQSHQQKHTEQAGGSPGQ